MRYFILFLFLVSTHLLQAQTRSDSLYFTNLYPLDNNEFLLIGSETAGSFRKCVIRLYDENMNIKSQKYERNMRNSKVFLDDVYGKTMRVISRYRWNKGRVFLYEDNLVLNSVRFFKRDDHKDWIKTEDEPFDYPLMRNENLLNLNPTLYNDKYCYYFAKEMRELFVYTYDVSFIKPKYQVINSFKIEGFGDIKMYKLLEENGRIYLFYQLKQQNTFKNFISTILLDGSGKMTTLEIIDNHHRLEVSDFTVTKDDKLILGGSYQENKNYVDSLRFCQEGWFVKIFDLAADKIEVLSETFQSKTATSPSRKRASKLVKIECKNDQINLLFENIVFDKRQVNLNDGIGLSGDYYSYETNSVDIVQYSWKDKQFRYSSVQLEFNLENEEKLRDKHWRTFHNNKKQTIFNLCFNGNYSYGYNDLSIVFSNFEKQFLVYADRNYNYYKCDWSSAEPKYELLNRNLEKAKCYFFDDFYIKYYLINKGFKLEKIIY